jgi:hypothetical protein
MVLCAHSDTGLLNETRSHSCTGAHIFLSKNELFPRFNGDVFSIAQIIKFVMASAAKSELAALPKSPIQTDNSTTAGVTNKTFVPRWAKMMDMRFLWLCCHPSQDQFRSYWDAGSKNWADYHTKHYLDIYHEAHQSTHTGIWDPVGT